MSQTSDEDLHYLGPKTMKTDMPLETVDMAREGLDTHSYSGTEDFKWQHESVLLLCSLYRAKKEQFLSGFVKKRDLWAEVAAEMGVQGFTVNHVICEKKWHNLCATFRKLKEYSRYNTKKRKCWAYYETFQEIFNHDVETQNTSFNPSACRSPESSCSNLTVVSMNQSQTPMCGPNMWPIQYHHHQIDTTTHSERGTPHTSGHDISSMLSVTLEENLDHQNNNNSNIRNGMPMSQQLCLDDFKWTHNSVMLLCSLYIARKEQFQSGAVKKRDLWTDIAQQMNQEGFPVTCTVCEKKWHNLIATYKKVILYNKKKTWPYLHIFQKILEEQAAHHISMSNVDYSSVTANNYAKDLNNHGICEKITVKEDISLLTPEEQVMYVESLNRNNDTIPDDFKWTHDSVISLCTLYKDRREDFQSNAVRKRDLWLEIASEMNVQGYCVTWVHCEKKWYNLYATYKKVTDQNRKRVRIWSTWPYLQLFQDIFDKNNVHREPIQHLPLINTYESESGTSHEVCSPSSSSSDPTCDISQEQIIQDDCHSNKRQCLEPAPIWFLEYCERQREQEDRRQQDTERQHRELIEAITRGNQALKDLSDNLKMYLNKCL